MSVIYGATVLQKFNNESNLLQGIIGKNSEQFYGNEIVTLSGGTVLGATGQDVVLGVVLQAQTMASDNQTVSKVAPSYIPADEGIFLMGADSDLTSPSSEGLYFGITGATGVQQISVATPGGTTGSTGAARVVEIVDVDPFNVGGTGSGSGLRMAAVRFVKTPYTNLGIATP